MNQISVIVVSAEEADFGVAEFWCDGELMGETCIEDGQLRLRIDARADGSPWHVDPSSLANGLAKAAGLIAAY